MSNNENHKKIRETEWAGAAWSTFAIAAKRATEAMRKFMIAYDKLELEGK